MSRDARIDDVASDAGSTVGSPHGTGLPDFLLPPMYPDSASQQASGPFVHPRIEVDPIGCQMRSVVVTRDVRWPKFVGTGMERNALPFKKDLSLSSFFSFFSFLERAFPLFPIFLWMSNPVFRRSSPVLSSFHLSKSVPCF